jgi:hypothetical protein
MTDHTIRPSYSIISRPASPSAGTAAPSPGASHKGQGRCAKRKSPPNAASGYSHFQPGLQSCAPYHPESLKGVSISGDMVLRIGACGKIQLAHGSADQAVARLVQLAIFPYFRKTHVRVTDNICSRKPLTLALAGSLYPGTDRG